MFGKLWQHNPCDQMDNFLLGNLILTFTLRQVSLLGYGCVKTTFYLLIAIVHNIFINEHRVDRFIDLQS